MERRKIRVALNSLMITVMCCAFTAVGYGITSFIYGFTGKPSEIFTHIFSWMTGFLIMIVIISLVRLIIIKHNPNEWKKVDLYGSLLTALEQISHGDFNVLIEPHDKVGHHELVNAINDMAKNLGTLETMRQDFISNISHEIQSPLTSIGGFAVLLQDDTLTDEQRKHYAAIIKTESERLSRMSENLLKLSTLESKENILSTNEFRLDKQIENVLLTLEPQWSLKNILPEAELSKTLYFGDEELLSQVWVNILSNAIKFTPENGKINIALKHEKDFYCIDISDTGIGIEPESKMHIFERFYKADKSRDRSLGGNGLGLSLVKKIVELHGGYVTVESEINQGTVFSVFLPLEK